MFKAEYPVSEVKAVLNDVVKLSVIAPEITRSAKPGQFAHIFCGGGLQSLTRRPLSISSVKDDEVEFIFQVKGEGTRWLANRCMGEKIDMIAPIGNGFELPIAGELVLVAGGMGLVPLIFLGQTALSRGLKVTLLFGARNKNCVFGIEELAAKGAVIRLATEDGSAGEKGLVTIPAEKHISKDKPAGIFACGPCAMLEAVAEIGRKKDIPVQVSLEERMACGIGACRGCAVLIKRGAEKRYLNVCKDGPVFRGEEVFFID